MANRKPRVAKQIAGVPSEKDTIDCTSAITGPIIEMSRWPRIDRENPAAVEARINEYFDYCIAMNLKPSVEMLATALKTTHTTLNSWVERGGWKGELIADAKSTINAILSEMALNNMVNPTTVIWFQKNHEGYQDNYRLDTRQNTGLDALPSREEILKRLPKEPDDDEIEEAEFKEIKDDGEKGEGSNGSEEGSGAELHGDMD